MFKEERQDCAFTWSMLGDVEHGRPNLGRTADVGVYRLMQYTLRDTIIKEFGVEAADRVFLEAGTRAGREFARNMVGDCKDLTEFITALQESLKNLGVGILRVEAADPEKMNFTLTVAEDLDCSGLPVCDETVCTYDEGFIAGLLAEQLGQNFVAREIDCWCTGDRVCRFDVRLA